MKPDYDPQKVFAMITDDTMVLESAHIINLLKKDFCRITQEEADQVIKEYDADEDGTLNFDEFS